jgi:TrmH family RNA methyltransferase
MAEAADGVNREDRQGTPGGPKGVFTDDERPLPPNLDNVHVVLVQPRVPGNIGAVARAMMTMGLSRLVLVDPCDYGPSTEAPARARAAQEVLDNAKVVDTLDAGLEGLTLVIGTTAKRRRQGMRSVVPLREGVAELVPVSQTQPVGLLFGREQWGLDSSELGRCQLWASIPSAHDTLSLNLSHAVMIACYEVYTQSCGGEFETIPLEVASLNDVERMYDHLLSALVEVGFVPRGGRESFTQSLRRAFSRAKLETRDVDVFHRIAQQMEWFARKGWERKREGAEVIPERLQEGDRRKPPAGSQGPRGPEGPQGRL